MKRNKKRRKIFLIGCVLVIVFLCLTIMFSGCADKKTDPENPSPTDFIAEDFSRDRTGSMFKHNGFYYYPSYQGGVKKIKYYNPQTGKSEYLCSKPDCEHAENFETTDFLSENICTAFVGTSFFYEANTNAMVTDGEWVYTSGSDNKTAFVFRISLDGAVKEKIADIGKIYSNDDERFPIQLDSFEYFDGYIYYSINVPKYDPELIDSENVSFEGFSRGVLEFRVKASPGSRPEAISANQSGKGAFNSVSSKFFPAPDKLFRLYKENGNNESQMDFFSLDTDRLEYKSEFTYDELVSMFLIENKLWYAKENDDETLELYNFFLDSGEEKQLLHIDNPKNLRLIIYNIFSGSGESDYFLISFLGWDFNYYVKENGGYKLVKSSSFEDMQLIGMDKNNMFFKNSSYNIFVCSVQDYLNLKNNDDFHEIMSEI